MNWIKGISPITFPGLGIEIDPAAGFTLGPLTVNFYGVIIAAGLLLAVLYGWKRSRQFGFTQDDITDGVLCIVPFAVLCARAYYCVFQWDSFKDNPISVLYIWQGGLAIYGGVLGAVLGMAVYCFFKKIKLPALLDLVALGFLIGQSMGRWGNFFNREAYGAETDFFLRMGLMLTPDRFETSTMHYYHPTFLYESLWNLAGFLILHFWSKRRQFDGQVALGYAVWYGLGRAWIEGLRTDSLYWGNLRVSQILAVVSCVAGAIVLIIMALRSHDPAKLYVNQVAARAAAEAEETETAAEPETETVAEPETETVAEPETETEAE